MIWKRLVGVRKAPENICIQHVKKKAPGQHLPTGSADCLSPPVSENSFLSHSQDHSHSSYYHSYSDHHFYADSDSYLVSDLKFHDIFSDSLFE